MLPDVSNDRIVQAARVLDCQFVETFFFRCALDAGFGLKSEDKARELHNIWLRQGLEQLPPYVRDYARRILKGVKNAPYAA